MSNEITTDPSVCDIVPLPAAFKEREGVAMLVAVKPVQCWHLRVSFSVDVVSGRCHCKACNAEVSPMFVLQQLMNAESQWMRSRAEYQDEMKRLAERESTKCSHCGKMTRISHR